MKKVLFFFGLVSLFTGCLKNNTDTEQKCTYDPCSYKVPASEIQALKDTLAKYNITATEHCSGLFYAIDNPGTGVVPTACSYIAVKYKGTFTNGSVFDETDPGEAISFPLSGVIRGWTNGIPLIKSGGKIRLYIPPSLGYGKEDYRGIPGNSILFFEVELVAVQ
jgi:FKBP-type peptidyl-prolyl cis-trans isomerase FkpA